MIVTIAATMVIIVLLIVFWELWAGIFIWLLMGAVALLVIGGVITALTVGGIWTYQRVDAYSTQNCGVFNQDMGMLELCDPDQSEEIIAYNSLDIGATYYHKGKVYIKQGSKARDTVSKQVTTTNDVIILIILLSIVGAIIFFVLKDRGLIKLPNLRLKK